MRNWFSSYASIRYPLTKKRVQKKEAGMWPCRNRSTLAGAGCETANPQEDGWRKEGIKGKEEKAKGAKVHYKKDQRGEQS